MPGLDDLYREIILDHYRTPRNRGELPPPAAHAVGHNPLCGDEIEVYLDVHDGVVHDIKVGGQGCSISQSSASMMSQSRYDKLSADEKKAVDAIAGETYARIIGRNWDKVDRRGLALMQANNVQMVKADAAFVADVKSRTSALEAKWVKEAEAKGLKDAAKVLAEFRAEIAKQSK